MSERLVSRRVPYIPVRVAFGRKSGDFEALLDTGFEGDVIVPEGFAAGAGQPDGFRVFRLADGREVARPAYDGAITVGQFGTFPVVVVALGGECLIGMRIASRFSITLDHGRQIIVEP